MPSAVGLPAIHNADSIATVAHRARPYRQTIRTLEHIRLDSTTSGILRDVSEFGVALQTVAPLNVDQRIHLQLELHSPRVRIEAIGRITWTDSWGQAGAQFLDLPPRAERQLKEWIFTQIISAAYLFAPCESETPQGDRIAGATELLFSAASRPPIRIDTPQLQPSDPLSQNSPGRSVRLLWFPVSISQHQLGMLVDALVLLCSVLLFAVIAMATTNIIPSWPVATGLAIVVAGIFVAVYRMVFAYSTGSTPGKHLARLACSEAMKGRQQEENRSRFR
jgi:hypothetical protein